MAVTKRLPNPPKTPHSVSSLITYIINPEKTCDEKSLYVNSINCSTIGAQEQFKFVRYRWNKNSGNLAYHFIQSFAPNEVTAKEAHQCGMELAKALFGDNGYQVVVGTHLDRGHLHNHIGVNSVNALDGKKLQTDHDFIRKMRIENDRICREHKLSVITCPKGKGKTYAEWVIEKNGGFTWRGEIRKDIDALIPTVSTFKELLNRLTEQGYTINRGRKYLSVSPPGTNTNFRFYKLGYGYTEESIAERILLSRLSKPLQPAKEAFYRKPRYKARYQGKFTGLKRRSGFRSLYYSYLYRLRNLSNAPVSHQRNLPMDIRRDMKLLDDFAADLTLLSKYAIDNVSQLASVYLFLKENHNTLLSKRQELRVKLSACNSPHELSGISKEIGNINQDIKKQRKELKSCERIYERSKKVQKASKQLLYMEVKSISKSQKSNNKNNRIAITGNEPRKD